MWSGGLKEEIFNNALNSVEIFSKKADETSPSSNDELKNNQSTEPKKVSPDAATSKVDPVDIPAIVKASVAKIVDNRFSEVDDEGFVPRSPVQFDNQVPDYNPVPVPSTPGKKACPHCFKLISQNNLARHITAIHGSGTLYRTDRGPLGILPPKNQRPCEYCGKIVLASNISRHIQTIHGIYRCSILNCKYTSTDKDDIKAHRDRHYTE